MSNPNRLTQKRASQDAPFLVMGKSLDFVILTVLLGGLLLTQCVFLPKNLLGVAILVIMPALVLIPVVYSFVYYNRHDKK